MELKTTLTIKKVNEGTFKDDKGEIINWATVNFVAKGLVDLEGEMVETIQIESASVPFDNLAEYKALKGKPTTFAVIASFNRDKNVMKYRLANIIK